MKFNVNVAKSSFGVVRSPFEKKTNFWEKNKTFDKANKSLSSPSFVLLDGPPYANGNAHIGHALNKLMKDLVVKSQWFMGHPVLYQPGWDCHGLPLELAAEKQFGKMEVEDLKKACKKLAFKSVVKQRKSFKKLDVLGDWDSPYLTCSNEMVKESWKTLKVLFDKKLLEYKKYPVHYCPVCASSLAQAELETKLLKKESLYFRLKLLSKENVKAKTSYALVWTTTPWTLPMNQGVAFNSSFVYEKWENESDYLYLQNSKEEEVLKYLEENKYVFKENVNNFDFDLAQSPLSKNVVPVLNCLWVEEGKTGFVHLAFSHGVEDFLEGKKKNLEPKTFLNKNGVFENLPEEWNLNGKKYTHVSLEVCQLLKLENLDVSYSESMTEQSVCWRHKCGVYYQATHQVFLNLEKKEFNLKEKVENLLKFSNVHKKDQLLNMLKSREHWCLSRQRHWGTPLNLLVDKKSNQLHESSSRYLQACYEGDTQTQNDLESLTNVWVLKDVVDVWFDSGNVANAVSHLRGVSPTVDLVVEGKDQYRGWFQSLLWLTVAVHEKLPFKDVLCHGFVLDKFKNKFSKSSGNGGPVEQYVDEYGSDVLRLWVASQLAESDPVLSKEKMDETVKLYQRFRLGLRFLTSNLSDYPLESHDKFLNQVKTHPHFDLHLWMLKEMRELHQSWNELLKSYQFKKALDLLYALFDKKLSAFYFDTLKHPLYLKEKDNQKRRVHQAGMVEVLKYCFSFVKVFCPEVAETFYQSLFFNKDNSVLEENLDSNLLSWVDESRTYFDWDELMGLKNNLNLELEEWVKLKKVKSKQELSVCVEYTTGQYESWGNQEVYDLREFLQVSGVEFKKVENQSVLTFEKLSENKDYQKCPRCWFYVQKNKSLPYEKEGEVSYVCLECWKAEDMN